MAGYQPDYIKEKAKANYELIKILSVLFITIAVGTISELKAIDFDKGIADISISKSILILAGFVFLASISSFVVYYIGVTNRLLKKLNEREEP